MQIAKTYSNRPLVFPAIAFGAQPLPVAWVGAASHAVHEGRVAPVGGADAPFPARCHLSQSARKAEADITVVRLGAGRSSHSLLPKLFSAGWWWPWRSPWWWPWWCPLWCPLWWPLWWAWWWAWWGIHVAHLGCLLLFIGIITRATTCACEKIVAGRGPSPLQRARKLRQGLKICNLGGVCGSNRGRGAILDVRIRLRIAPSIGHLGLMGTWI